MAQVQLPENITIQVEYPNTNGGMVDIEVAPNTMKGLMLGNKRKDIQRQMQDLIMKHGSAKKEVKNKDGKRILLTGLDALSNNHPDVVSFQLLFAEQIPYDIESRVVRWSLVDNTGNEIEPIVKNILNLDVDFITEVAKRIRELDEKKSK